jgi:uncharacterized membrane protein YccF (DUF307 family)
MLPRKQETISQLNQLLDAGILGLVFWLSHFLSSVTLSTMPFTHSLWVLAVTMPFGPFLLERQGFYNYPLKKTILKSLQQIAWAGVWLGLLLGTTVIFLRLEIPNWSALVVFCVLAPIALVFKERVPIWRQPSGG